MKGASTALFCFGLAVAPVLPAAAAEPSASQTVASSPEPSPEALALAREAVNNGFPPQQRSALFRNIMDAMIAQMRAGYQQRFDDAGVQQILDHYIDGLKAEALTALDARTPALFEAFARAYAREFSIDELRQIRDFTATPAGRHFASRGGTLINDPDVKAVNIAFIAVVHRIAEARQPAFVSELTTYLAKHPDAARKISQQSASHTEPAKP